MKSALLAERTALYRFYDADDALIYVGVTGELKKRIAAHARKPWWPTVARQTVDWHEDRSDALAIETEDILKHRPQWNMRHDGETGVVHRIRIPDRSAWREAVANAEAEGRSISAVIASFLDEYNAAAARRRKMEGMEGADLPETADGA